MFDDVILTLGAAKVVVALYSFAPNPGVSPSIEAVGKVSCIFIEHRTARQGQDNPYYTLSDILYC